YWTSLFDGHDASINMIRRLLQQSGAEVIHLGHNRSVKDVVTAAIQENAHAILVSSYQGGHLEYFKYLFDLLKEYGAESRIKIFGGGGGVIIPEEIKELHNYGITRIYSPEDGATMGLQGMINDILGKCNIPNLPDKSELNPNFESPTLSKQQMYLISKLITQIESNTESDNLSFLDSLTFNNSKYKIPIIGITGTGGAGKSSFTDELVLRFLEDNDDLRVGILSIDPSKRRTGGALLGDRIRMNAIESDRVFMRSFATKQGTTKIMEILPIITKFYKKTGFDLVFIETPG
ncbi:unnamed protein product, partial [marine sediment metagenome]